ncbi:MAG: tRNA 2-thiouridine(34) synthase MnmA [Thermodesulfovibrionales bacterium]|nr:tRNA 2-thiouridine(34) synthase MnmA [Thermodesulfovibrionales bacterium]
MSKVIVGMSGGVDSSVTAYLLKQQGYEVEGVSFILYEARLKNTFTGCCSIEAIKDAGSTAAHMGVRHTSVDLREEFMERVIEPFITAYSKGITPNPCIMCNKYIKFPYLLEIASEKDADFIATGHYARIEDQKLLKGIDAKKDQSYVLYILRTEEIKRLKLPLGDKKKDEVRKIAKTMNLPAANRPESQEICFIEDRNYFKFLENLTEAGEGLIIDVETGKLIGRHKGIHLYTIGQRKRLGLSTGKPLFVTRIDPSKNAIYVGPREAAMMKEFVVKDVNWLMTDYELQVTNYKFTATVKVRSTMKDEPATVIVLDNDRVEIVYNEPQWAPAPGQSAVFYNGEVVIGGGIIAG